MHQFTIQFPRKPRRVTVTADFEPDPIDTDWEEVSEVRSELGTGEEAERPSLRLVVGGQR